MPWLRRLLQPTPPSASTDGLTVRVPAHLADRLNGHGRPLELAVIAALEAHLAEPSVSDTAGPPAAAFWTDRAQSGPPSDIEDVLRSRVHRRRAAEAQS